ncbi:MAG: hypothetical protein HUU48_04925 [Flavobacteriales bacterium]|nr:hypothetical protein [Flavobacteriales bacterium]
MKKIIPFSLLIITSILLTSCVTVVNNTPGRPGRDGRAFFGINYQHRAPYSYWDNNPAIPNNPTLGNYFPTAPGIYQFEYFVNPYEYWYGTYEIAINLGGPGGPHGEPGFDGKDTYLMLFCDPNGFYTHFNQYRTSGSYNEANSTVVIERVEEGYKYKITMQKATREKRSSHTPKLISTPN